MPIQVCFCSKLCVSFSLLGAVTVCLTVEEVEREVLLAALGADPVSVYSFHFLLPFKGSSLAGPCALVPHLLSHRSSSRPAVQPGKHKPNDPRGAIALLKAFRGLPWRLGERPGSLLGLRLPSS